MKFVIAVGLIAGAIAIMAAIGEVYMMFPSHAQAGDKKEFGELLGTIANTKIYRFETPSAVCFTRDSAISCVANK